MKKHLSLPIACASLLALLLGGCGDTSSDGKIQVVVGMWPQAQQKEDVNMFTVWKERFESDHPEYEIVAQPYTYSSETVTQMALAGTLPTVFQTYFTEPPMLIDGDIIRPVTDLVKEVGYYDDMDAFMRATLEDEEGELYGVPRDGYGFGMLLNLKTLNMYGLIDGDYSKHEYVLHDDEGNPLYPTTFEELHDFCQKLYQNSGESVAGTMIYSANKQGGWLLSNFAWSFGATLEVEENGSWRGNLATEEMVDTLEYVQSLKTDGCLIPDTNITYNDWYNKINEQVGLVFVGNDVVQNAVTQAGVDRQDIAFVPMPEGPGGRYTLYGGTPYVFSADASDEQVRGALIFLEYMGRAPIMSEACKTAMEEGKEVSLQKNEPIIPSIRPWTNEDYNSFADELDERYVNVNMDYFSDFYDTVNEMRHPEVEHYAQEMYAQLDKAVYSSLTNPTRSRDEIMNQLITINAEWNRNFQ